MHTSPIVRKHKRAIVKRLIQVRGDRSQRQFARDIGVSQQNISHYERGTTPHPNFLIMLALKENVSPDWLLLGRGPMKRRMK